MSIDKVNVVETSKGVIGFLMTIIPTWLSSIDNAITFLSSVLGLVLLSLSVRSMYINTKVKKLELRKIKEELEKSNQIKKL